MSCFNVFILFCQVQEAKEKKYLYKLLSHPKIRFLPLGTGRKNMGTNRGISLNRNCSAPRIILFPERIPPSPMVFLNLSKALCSCFGDFL